jgi:GGDEF domain-containing protein
VTVTGGVASYPQNGTTRDDLVRAADEALYAGKQAGRNRILVAPHP